jgi:hypothetical protein
MLNLFQLLLIAPSTFSKPFVPSLRQIFPCDRNDKRKGFADCNFPEQQENRISSCLFLVIPTKEGSAKGYQKCIIKLFKFPLLRYFLHSLSFIPFCLETKRNRKNSRQERWLRPLCQPAHKDQSLQDAFFHFISVDYLIILFPTKAFQKV